MNSGYSRELNVQKDSYLMVFSSCSENRYSLICVENWYTLKLIKIFQIRRNIMPKDGSHFGYCLFPVVCSPLFVLTRDFADDRRLINAYVGLPIDQPLSSCLKALITVLDLVDK